MELDNTTARKLVQQLYPAYLEQRTVEHCSWWKFINESKLGVMVEFDENGHGHYHVVDERNFFIARLRYGI